MAWSKQRLEEVARTRLNGAKLIVVANREPYIHRHHNGGIDCMRPAGGLTTALDPVMQACGGVWIAHGSGDADRVTADEFGRTFVPPDDPRYVLRRVWLDRESEQGYYYGLANSTLWPLCHQVFCPPTFNASDWRHYQAVNRMFADAVLEEACGEPAIVFVQDYHFALLPRMIKDARPDLVVVQFWHIPWPNPETIRVCPWAAEIVQGMLGNDLLAFQIQYHCNNFLETVDRTLESRTCWERFSVTHGGHETRVRPFAISVDPDQATEFVPDNWQRRARVLRRRYGFGDRPLLVGVDRVDYTKGIPERLRGLDHFLAAHPEWIGRFHFVQVGAPSRTDLTAYRDLNTTIADLAADINCRYGTPDWRPVTFINEHCGPEQVFMLYRMAAACIVSSLHDGMNLVAKEFCAARSDERGALILSQFTGAARELADSLIVNPFDAGQMADAYFSALTMPAEEQQRRMRRLRKVIVDNSVFRWAGMLLSEACKLCDDVATEESLAGPNDGLSLSDWRSEFGPALRRGQRRSAVVAAE